MRWAPNPYAIAEQILGRSLQKADATFADGFLREALLKGKAPSVGEAFSLFEKLASLLDHPETLDEVMKQPLVKQAVDWFGLEAIERVLPDLLPIADAIFEAFEASGPPPDPRAGQESSAQYADADQLLVGGTSYLDPIQGNVADCYLISAMIALAWSKQDLLTSRLNLTGYSPRRRQSFAWTFYDRQGALATRVNISARIPMKKGLPRYARSAAPSEYWPGLIEKAYVAKVRPSNPKNAEPRVADYQMIGRLTTPQAACKALAGGRARSKTWFSEQGKDVYAHLCKRIGASGVTTGPVMAWTHDTVGVRSYDYWTKTGIWPNHAYAVLGKMPSNHVVLRNPHGHPTERREGYSEKEEWLPAGNDPVELNKAGVFAISPELLNRYFGHLGWIDYE